METKNEEQLEEVLLVQEKSKNELKVLGEPKKDDKQPNLKDPTDANKNDFLRIDKNGNALENFFKNFYRQFENPTDFDFYKIPAQKIEQTAAYFKKLLNKPNDTINKMVLANAKIDPETFIKMARKDLDPTRIMWKELEDVGISYEYLQSSGNLEGLLKWRKSKELIPINVKVGDQTKLTFARLQFIEAEGGVRPLINLVHNKPNLDVPYYGASFTEEDKLNLLRTGNAGRIIDIKARGEIIPVLVSIDNLTKQIVSIPLENVKIPDNYKGATLTEDQKAALKNGEEVLIKNMKTVKNTPFDATVQYNADKFGLETTGYGQINKFTFGNSFMRVQLSKEQQDFLNNGYSVYLENLLPDKTKTHFSSWVTYDPETNRPIFSKTPTNEVPAPENKQESNPENNLSQKNTTQPQDNNLDQNNMLEQNNNSKENKAVKIGR